MVFRPRVGITEPERIVDIGRGMRGEGFDNFGYPLFAAAAFSVVQRTREIAVRMALGATGESVLALILRQAACLALIGAGVGLALALGVGMVLQSLLIGIRPIDPVAFGAATLTLMVVLLAASWVPARRASRLDPMRALRSE